ncbi:MAG TPA: YraN family protein [Candidatus Binataceae bacterium]|nr:YraN family protein [Candidatus Binataceae bacterium]
MPPIPSHSRSIRNWIRRPYIALGELLDRCYEELPWRRRLPLGPRGEQIARRYLRRCGYLILARNYRAMGAEIDLVALDDAALVFVEVKARSGLEAGTPQEAVDERKQEQIRRAAEAYVAARHAHGVATRFDVIAITGAGRRRKLELIKDAF